MSLKGSAEKLFFVLVYLKQNPLQSYHGQLFQMSQGKVSHWLKVLLPLLEAALEKRRVLPTRTPSHLYQSLRLLAGQVLYLDAAERAVPARTIGNGKNRNIVARKAIIPMMTALMPAL